MSGRNWRKTIVERDMSVCWDNLESLSEESVEFITYIKMRLIEDSMFANRMEHGDFNRLQEIAHNINHIEVDDENEI